VLQTAIAPMAVGVAEATAKRSGKIGFSGSGFVTKMRDAK